MLDSDVCTRVFIDTYGAGEGAINWPAFRAIGYTGVEINPYSMTFRYEDWYNAWDVESGVVWEHRCEITGKFFLGPGNYW